MRRIVTGHNKDGKSIVILDGPPARTIGEDVGGLFELWNQTAKLSTPQILLIELTMRLSCLLLKTVQSLGTFKSIQLQKAFQWKSCRRLLLMLLKK